MRRRFAATILLATSSFACSVRNESRPRADSRSIAEERERRQAPVAEIAPAPAASSLALAGAEGQDAFGYPTRYVERPALRGLLQRRKFKELNSQVERLQAEFEADPRREDWPNDAAEALGTAESQLLPLLDAWVAASPDSFAPFLARGTHWVRAAYARRGSKWAGETPSEDFASMEEALPKAAADLERALLIRPKLIAAMREHLNLNLLSAGGHRKNSEVIARALDICPSCFQIRVTYLHTLKPRWGGSYDQMRRFIQERSDDRNPRLRLLPGYIDLDQAQDLRADKKYEAALVKADGACTLGEHWEFLVSRARARVELNDLAAALSDLDRALVLRPGHPDILAERAYAYTHARRWEEAGLDLRAGIQVAPTQWLARSIFESVVKGLVYDGWQRNQGGDRAGALRVFDLAAELAPNNRDVQSRRAQLIAGGEAADAGVDEEVQGGRDDFRAVQQLDYRLARQRQFDRVVAVWNAFLARHPDHGPAYLERGGALFNLRRLPEARADALKACDLGVSEGCVRAKQLAR
jgi:tetratricopeptide (TPR) repeat protein